MPVMSEAGDERLCRYMLLLAQGGQLVLRGVLLRQVSNHQQSLKAILSNNKNILSRAAKDQPEFKQIFPTQTAVNTDTPTWDIALLGFVLIQVFGSELSPSDMKDVKKIYEQRLRMEGMTSSVSLPEPDYRTRRLQISMSLLRLASGTDFNTHYECLDIVSTTGAKPLGFHHMLQQLAELKEFPRGTLEIICSKLEINMEEIDLLLDTDISRSWSSVHRDSFTRASRGRAKDLHTESWYFGTLTRDETHEIFEPVKTDGVFLVRECLSTPGDFVLCVKEGNRMCQYVISRLHADGNIVYRIGEKDFEEVAELLEFYRTHYLEKTPLTEPAPRKKVLTTFDFEGTDSKDLTFKKGEVLEIISKEDNKWLHARNKDGKIGLVPKLYLTSQKDVDRTDGHGKSPTEPQKSEKKSGDTSPTPPVPKRLPSKAVVTKARISSPYDDSQLTLHEGDVVTVTKIIGDGHCWGDCKGKEGLFPSKNITFLDDM